MVWNGMKISFHTILKVWYGMESKNFAWYGMVWNQKNGMESTLV